MIFGKKPEKKEEKLFRGDLTYSVVMVSAANYPTAPVSILKKFINQHQKICYINLNHLINALVESFGQEGIDLRKICFVDGVTKTIFEKISSTPDQEFIVGFDSLSFLLDSIAKSVETNKASLLIFDSLSALLMYSSREMFMDFLETLLKDLKRLGCSAIFISLLEETRTELREELKELVENVFSIDEIVSLKEKPMIETVEWKKPKISKEEVLEKPLKEIKLKEPAKPEEIEEKVVEREPERKEKIDFERELKVLEKTEMKKTETSEEKEKKRRKLEKNLDLLKAAFSSGFISRNAFEKDKGRIEKILKGL